MYKDIISNPNRFKIEYPDTIVPEPTDSDYQNGFIRRYFVIKGNDPNSHIFEVAKDVYENYSKNPFWKVASIPWRISGPIDPITNTDIKKADRGVKASNTNAILLAKAEMPRLALYIPDLIQFHISRRKTS
jgi:hypothetical protein